MDVKNQTLTEGIAYDGNSRIATGRVKIFVEAYPLPESEFEKLINPGLGGKEWARRFLLIALGSIVIFLAKIINFLNNFRLEEDKNNADLDVKKYEWIAILISLFLAGIIFAYSEIFKNKRDQLIDRIKNFFKSAVDE